MAVTSATSPTAALTGGTATSALGKDSVAQNFTTFLQLLTTQLRNQSPLDPLDTNQFIDRCAPLHASAVPSTFYRCRLILHAIPLSFHYIGQH
jgi:Flagellar hook capping protein - N-terminal region